MKKTHENGNSLGPWPVLINVRSRAKPTMQSIPCVHSYAPYTHSIPSPCGTDKTSKTLLRFGQNTSENISNGEPPGVGGAGAHPAPGGEAAGLVYSQTSGTRSDIPHSRAIRIDREGTRLKRLRFAVLTAARLHVQQRSRWRVAMLTLTYRDGVEWGPGQVSAIVRHIRQWLARKGIGMRHVWVQEFTKRGKPHYHMLLWLPLGITLPKPDKRGWWPWGMTRIEWARNAVGYIAKYASKADSLHRPAKGARMHGSGGLDGDAKLEQRWWKLPSWLRGDGQLPCPAGRVMPSDRVRRAPTAAGGGFIHPDTGECYRSPWIVFFRGGDVFIKMRDGGV